MSRNTPLSLQCQRCPAPLCVFFGLYALFQTAEARQTCSRNVSHFMLVVTTLFSAFSILISGGFLRVREQKYDSRVRS